MQRNAKDLDVVRKLPDVAVHHHRTTDTWALHKWSTALKHASVCRNSVTPVIASEQIFPTSHVKQPRVFPSALSLAIIPYFFGAKSEISAACFPSHQAPLVLFFDISSAYFGDQMCNNQTTHSCFCSLTEWLIFTLRNRFFFSSFSSRCQTPRVCLDITLKMSRCMKYNQLHTKKTPLYYKSENVLARERTRKWVFHDSSVLWWSYEAKVAPDSDLAWYLLESLISSGAFIFI